MESRVKRADELHKKQFNCCQSVFCNYADLLGIDEETAFKVSEGFGLGMGGQKEVCGAVSAMALAAGMKNSSGDVSKGVTKGETNKIVYALLEQFKTKNSSILCKELLGDGTKPKLRSCQGCIEDACQFIEDTLFKGEFEK